MKNLLKKSENTKSTGLILPAHIAIIMDGNRRWAKGKQLLSMFGHREGIKALHNVTKYANKIGVKYLTVYAFSTENWNRKKNEVDFLMRLIQDSIEAEVEEMNKDNVKFNVIGFCEELSPHLFKLLQDSAEKTKTNTGLSLRVAINYGSRAEITSAVKEIANDVLENKISVKEITPELISSKLFTGNIPDPDLLIRTGGEQRVSNYLLWQCAYTEIYTTDTLWPDFNERALDKAIEEYSHRQRRFGV